MRDVSPSSVVLETGTGTRTRADLVLKRVFSSSSFDWVDNKRNVEL